MNSKNKDIKILIPGQAHLGKQLQLLNYLLKEMVTELKQDLQNSIIFLNL
jgi:hypothetical protein